MSEKKLGGHRVCLGDTVQDIAKIGGFFFFYHVPRGAWSEFNKSWLKSNKFQTFQSILSILNLTA